MTELRDVTTVHGKCTYLYVAMQWNLAPHYGLQYEQIIFEVQAFLHQPTNVIYTMWSLG